jgi:hypothetical protein
MRNLGYTHGYACRATGLGMRHADPDYVAGFQAGYADQAREAAAQVAAVAVASDRVRWTDAMNVSTATVRLGARTERTYRVRLSGAHEFTAEWRYGYGGAAWKCIGRSYTREHGKARVIGHVAGWVA